MHSPAVVAVAVPEVYVDGGAVVGDAVVGASDVGVVVLWHWHSVQYSITGLGPQQSPPSQLHISVLAMSSQYPSATLLVSRHSE